MEISMEILQLIKEASLKEIDKNTIISLVDSIESKKLSEFDNRTFLFSGDPGVGKTHFVENLIKKLDLPVLFVGPFSFEHENVKHFKSLEELMVCLTNTEECIIFIDDLQNAIEVEHPEFGEPRLSDSEGKAFIKILEHVKRSSNRKYFFMTLNNGIRLEDSWMDRIETRIDFEEPNEKSKKKYLAKKYSSYLSNQLINELAMKTMGYNFRNLDELIKLAYRQGKGIISRKSIKEAISAYTPSSLKKFEVLHKTDIKFKDVIGNQSLKKELEYLKYYIKNKDFFKKRSIERSNVLLFAGPPGTGKTFMAKALAGEMDIPLINIDGKMFLEREPLQGIVKLTTLSRKFRNCIIFVDEVDKILGKQMMAEDTGFVGLLESEIDGINKKMEAIVIFTLNNKMRFGSAFHDRISCFDFDYPTEDERRTYLSSKITKSGVILPEQHLERLAQETQEKSYRQIEKIWNSLLFKLIERTGYNIKRNKIMLESGHIDSAMNEVLNSLRNKDIAYVG